MYFIELLITRSCNQRCYYCTTKKATGNQESDIDYLRYVLDCFPDETGVEITGGEIGLIDNIDDVFKVIYDHPKIKHIIALSNGYLRVRGVDWLDKVEYWEHLIFEIIEKEITKFYPLDLEQPHRYVVVANQQTTESLVEHWNYFKDLGMFRPNFFYKLMNHKSVLTIDRYKDYLFELYGRLQNKYFLNMLLTTVLPTYLSRERDICERYSPNPFVDIERKHLGHCAINVEQSDKWKFNQKNLEKLRNGEFYRGGDYCKICHSFDHGQNRGPNNNRSYEQ